MEDVLIIILIILLNAYFSLAELALVSVTKEDLSQGNLAQNNSAIGALRLIKSPEQFLSAVQVGTTLLGLIEGIYGGSVVAKALEIWLNTLGVSSTVSHIGALIIGIGSITYLTIVFGELVPKSIALQYPLKVSLAIAPSLLIFSKLAYPFIKILTFSTHKILALFPNKTLVHKEISENDLKKLLGAAFQQGLLEKQQFLMHENVIAFKNRKAESVMKPARITLTIQSEWQSEEVINFIKLKPYSYFPVVQGTDRKVIGLLKTKDFLLSDEKDWQKLIVDTCRIDAKLLVKEVFVKFRDMKKDFGIVSDKAGNFIGIITMQDIMEAVFGDLPELEDYGKYLNQQSDKIWIAEDFIHLQRVRRTLSLNWLRKYEGMYLSIGELLHGESAKMDNQGGLVLNEVTFKWINRPGGAAQIQIKLP